MKNLRFCIIFHVGSNFGFIRYGNEFRLMNSRYIYTIHTIIVYHPTNSKVGIFTTRHWFSRNGTSLIMREFYSTARCSPYTRVATRCRWCYSVSLSLSSAPSHLIPRHATGTIWTGWARKSLKVINIKSEHFEQWYKVWKGWKKINQVWFLSYFHILITI